MRITCFSAFLRHCHRLTWITAAQRAIILFLLGTTAYNYGSRTRTGKTPQYAVVDLVGWGGVEASASGINEAGHIVGTSDGVAFFWNGTMQHLKKPKNDYASSALGINNRDQIVGRFDTGSKSGALDEDEIFHTALWTITRTNGKIVSTLHDLDVPNTSKFPSATAAQISDSGTVVGLGESPFDGPEAHSYESGAFFCDPSTAPGIIYPPLSANGIAVSATGDIAACVWGYDPKHRDAQNVVLCRAVSGGFRIVRDFGRVPGDLGDSIALSLNNAGDIAGTFAPYTSNSNPSHGATYGNFSSFYRRKNDTAWTPLFGLPNLPSTTISGMNAFGDVVGKAEVDRRAYEPDKSRAVVWKNNNPLDLNDAVPRFCG